jgi:hypothetical protein
MADTTTTTTRTSPAVSPPSSAALPATNNILAAYEASAQYLEAQETLGMQLKKAFLLLARARMRVGAGGMMGSDFCREDLGATRRVKDNKVVTALASDNDDEDDEDEENDDPPPTKLEDLVLIMAGGLAPPELREAQQGFVQALESVVLLAMAADAILTTQRA